MRTDMQSLSGAENCSRCVRKAAIAVPPPQQQQQQLVLQQPQQCQQEHVAHVPYWVLAPQIQMLHGQLLKAEADLTWYRQEVEKLNTKLSYERRDNRRLKADLRWYETNYNWGQQTNNNSCHGHATRCCHQR